MELTFRLGGAMAQRDGQHAARLEQRDQLPERPRPIRWGDVHPDRTDQDDVEGKSGSKRAFEGGQRVANPLDSGTDVLFTSHRLEPGRRLDRNDAMTPVSQPRGVATTASTDVEDGRWP